MSNTKYALDKLLFKEEGYVYVLFDSTKNEDVHNQILLEEPNYIELYDVEKNPNFESITPFIIRLEKNSNFTKWIFEACQYQEIGFFFSSPSNDLEELKRHFDIFTQIQKYKDNRKFYFNFYNPVSLSLWLDVMPTKRRLEFFMMIHSIVIENEFDDGFKRFTLDIEGKLHLQNFKDNADEAGMPLEVEDAHTGTMYASTIQKPWVFSPEENNVMSKISRENFLIRIFKKIWKYKSVQERYSREILWKQFHIWAENFIKLGIERKQDLALFLVSISMYESLWKEHQEKIFAILHNKDEEARIRYMEIRDIVNKGDNNG